MPRELVDVHLAELRRAKPAFDPVEVVDRIYGVVTTPSKRERIVPQGRSGSGRRREPTFNPTRIVDEILRRRDEGIAPRNREEQNTWFRARSKS